MKSYTNSVANLYEQRDSSMLMKGPDSNVYWMFWGEPGIVNDELHIPMDAYSELVQQAASRIAYDDTRGKG